MVKFSKSRIGVPALLKIGENEFENIGQYLQKEDFTNVAVFWSSGIKEFFGDKITKSLDAAGIKVLEDAVIEDIDIENIVHTAFSIPKRVQALVGIGGGKALDYSKYCAHLLSLPFISVPTSTSNDGFCSPTSSLLVSGKRKTVSSKLPYGIVVDLNAIITSPESGIYSGIGDLISKVTAGWDWKRAAAKGNDSFNDFAYLISQNTVSDFLNYQNYSIRSVIFHHHLTMSLLMNGISMEIAGSSRPASGSEHLISHALDSISEHPKMHGIQVGLATYLCSYLQNHQFKLVHNFLVNTGFFAYIEKSPLSRREFIEAVRIAPTVKEDFYTVLSEEDSFDRAMDFIATDPYFKKLLV